MTRAILCLLALGCVDFNGPDGYRLVCVKAHTDTLYLAGADSVTLAGIVTIAYPDYCQWRKER